ncbi:hypothetical protein [Burkholderia savannae]|uniref:hypothetical protein n=1 Tax=Burkholderia savannae TaxID=1637837 RepID=UPI0012E353E2|nr:hypothetical protein [Burkholderia savannae]
MLAMENESGKTNDAVTRCKRPALRPGAPARSDGFAERFRMDGCAGFRMGGCAEPPCRTASPRDFVNQRHGATR